MGKEAKTSQKSETTTEETKSKFAGTNILKTFQQIIDREFLTTTPPKHHLNFLRKRIPLCSTKPIIDYSDNTISLKFNPKPHMSDPNTLIDYPSNQYYISYDSLVVQKTGDKQFSLTINQSDSTGIIRRKKEEPQFGNNSEIIKHIAEFIFKETGHNLTISPQP
jgi:hypothetical protein